MSNTELNCCKCGKEFEFTEKIYTCGDLWQCEDCAIKQMQENDDKDKTISDLEAKLAESEERCTKMWKWEVQQINRLKEENNQLNQQLSDKDKEVQQWKSMAERSSSILDRFNYCGESIIYNTTREQDKISFAVEKLYNVRCFVEDIDFNYGDDKRIDRFAVMNEIDDIIEQLTHQHEDKGE